MNIIDWKIKSKAAKLLNFENYLKIFYLYDKRAKQYEYFKKYLWPQDIVNIAYKDMQLFFTQVVSCCLSGSKLETGLVFPTLEFS